jgi:RNA polymerase sigma factor (TIGR02999 family)
MDANLDRNSAAIAQTVIAAKRGDRKAASQLLPLLYGELRSLARALLHQLPPGQTLNATCLVHEAYAKLVRTCDPGWDGRGHFFAAASQAMREILVDQARRKSAIKRGGNLQREEFDVNQIFLDTPSDDVLALHDAIAKLEAEDPRKAQIVTMRYFGGLQMKQIAEELGISRATVDREWRFTRAWLYRELDKGGH